MLKMSLTCESKKQRLFESLKSFAQEKHSVQIEDILVSDNTELHYAIPVHASSLLEFSIEFASFLFNEPQYALKLLNEAFLEAASEVYSQHKFKSNLLMKQNVHVRLTSLPFCSEIYRTILPQCNDVGQFLCITATVVRTTVMKMLEHRKKWQCNKCKHTFTVDLEIEQNFTIVKPVVCTSPEWCNNKNFTLLSQDLKPEWCKDYQEVKIQEQVNNLVVGTVPRSMWVILTDELVDCCQPGNDVLISGVLHTRWQPLVAGARSEIELVLMAHNVEVTNNSLALDAQSEDSIQEFLQFWRSYCHSPLEGRDFILSCLCPQVFGLYVVKLAVALVLAGGTQRIDNNSKIRGDTHLLLVGDPGTGKSQFLKYASKISRRSVLTSGVGTTTAGLTAAAVKDGGKWQLEAGALVLADGGICCIDEFSNIKEHDKTSIHEAMEQQTISVAKAGLVCKLSTQCSILAATNPKGKYNKNESLSINTAMASPLLSRFDIILVLLDTYSEEWDKLVSSYILQGKDMVSESKGPTAWSLTKMRTYFSTVKNIKPKSTAVSDRILQAYYRKQRSMADRSAARTTPRLLQSLVRLAQGHARLMFRPVILAIDAIIAIIVMESSMVGCGLFNGSDALHTTFPEDPQLLFAEQAKIILQMLSLSDLLEEVQQLPNVQHLENIESLIPANKTIKVYSQVPQSETASASNCITGNAPDVTFPDCGVDETISTGLSCIDPPKIFEVCNDVLTNHAPDKSLSKYFATCSDDQETKYLLNEVCSQTNIKESANHKIQNKRLSDTFSDELAPKRNKISRADSDNFSDDDLDHIISTMGKATDISFVAACDASKEIKVVQQPPVCQAGIQSISSKCASTTQVRNANNSTMIEAKPKQCENNLIDNVSTLSELDALFCMDDSENDGHSSVQGYAENLRKFAFAGRKSLENKTVSEYQGHLRDNNMNSEPIVKNEGTCSKNLPKSNDADNLDNSLLIDKCCIDSFELSFDMSDF